MLSVIIATRDSERAVVPTLAALVSGATAGIIREVLVADGGSSDDTAAVAEVAGCNFFVLDGTTAQRLKTAAGKARARWLLFLRPGTILDAPWTGDARRFVELTARPDCAAVFRRGAPMQSGLRDALSLLASALGARPRPEQGLLIAKEFYGALGGHSETAADAETDLIRRIGRRRIVRLPSIAYSAL
ncbi:MAG TPA: glycosyl transferase [Xanthobacteraceae bacterium]|nr:glycosyl transferase [Xanthobacteraceae bacterium]